MADYQESEVGLAAIQYRSNRYARAVADAVREDMKRLCPVYTGRLRDSIRSEAAGDAVYIYIGSTSIPVPWPGYKHPQQYWKYVEFGTSHQVAHPFIRPALARRRNVLEIELYY